MDQQFEMNKLSFKDVLEVVELEMIIVSIPLTYELGTTQELIPLNNGRLLNE